MRAFVVFFSLIVVVRAHVAELPSQSRRAEPWAIEDWTVIEYEGSLHKDGFLVNTTKYVSPTIRLMTGEAFFSLNPFTRIPFPAGDYTLLEFNVTMVNAETEVPTSLAEVYNHHWLIGTPDSLNVLEPCEGNLFFGGGAEFRGPGLGGGLKDDGIHGMIRIGAKGYCGGNLHFIRTEDLATNWTGLNDPHGDYGAAVKNCIECGYAPGRAPFVCTEAFDGQFNCCFDGSRCPVNHPEDKSKKGYRLEYSVQWSRDLLVRKSTQSGVLDVGGGAVEWNVAPNLDHPPSFPPVHQICNDTVCSTTNNFTVRKMLDTELGVCPGTMYISVLHQHTGAISGTMFVNGVEKCTSYPKIGTVAGTGPESVGDERGYLVGFHNCIDQEHFNNSVRLNEGDIVTLTGLYDVDVNSTRNLPMTGGKHGGIMMLYFYGIDCDPGTYKTQFVCRQNRCIPAPKGDFNTEASCAQACHDSGNAFV